MLVVYFIWSCDRMIIYYCLVTLCPFAYRILKIMLPISHVLNDYTNCRLYNLQELRMYNANYLERPYIVVLNKIDIPEVCV